MFPNTKASYALGHWLVRLTDSTFHKTGFVVTVGLIVGVIATIVHVWLESLLPNYFVPELSSIVIVGTIVALVTYIEISAVQTRRKRLIDEMRVIAELNHRVRNSLQTIAYAAHVPTREQVEIIDECVEKIDGTLHDLFPVLDERGPLP